MIDIDEFLRHFIIPEFVFIFSMLVGALFLYKFYYDFHTPKVKLVKKRVDEFLTGLILSYSDKESIEAEIRGFVKEIPLHKKWCKRVVLHKLMFLHQNLRGDVTKELYYIYECFGLYEFTLSYLNSWFWNTKCEGLVQLRELKYKIGKDYALKYIGSKNQTLSSNAYLALMVMEPDDLDFLIDYSHHANYAGEINIIDFIHHNKPPKPKNLNEWIYRNEVTTIILGLKFMIFYNFTEENKKILELLRHENWEVRHEAIHAISVLSIFEGEDELIELFYREDRVENKIEILETLKSIGSDSTKIFLTEILNSDEVADIKLKAVFCLNVTNKTYLIETFEGNDDVERMIKHVNIKYI